MLSRPLCHSFMLQSSLNHGKQFCLLARSSEVMQSSAAAISSNTAVLCGDGIWPGCLRSHTQLHSADKKLVGGIVPAKGLHSCVALMFTCMNHLLGRHCIIIRSTMLLVSCSFRIVFLAMLTLLDSVTDV